MLQATDREVLIIHAGAGLFLNHDFQYLGAGGKNGSQRPR